MYSKTILIVDDEPRTRLGLQTTLEVWAAGRYDILSTAGGDEALEVLNQRKVHLLLTDIRMPEMTGLKLIEVLQQKAEKPVIIIISAYSEFEYAQQAIRLGVVNYLLKPLNKGKLIEAVEQGLEVEANRERAGIIEKVVDDRLIAIKKEDRNSRSPIREAMRYVDENLKSPLSLREVADHVHLNASYFSVLFKEQTNLTFGEYVTRSRLQLAKSLLLTTKLPIAAIAEEVGYQTAKYFIKLFKEYEGITPNQFRKRAEEVRKSI
ncbi:response regulator [Brevibacillus humidisoli]|uniref:response regulator transcription factor n=1 Tax=Brevibacillus humidisoli TaxID=2895522 RepID=UPI001E352BBF|nr:response regulator [Brevibacillus humidisoli]UFJ43291.1 response regulator [Brevibacillus humidisoli]